MSVNSTGVDTSYPTQPIRQKN